MAMGYIGPKRTPITETATAPPTRDGTSQTTSSNAIASVAYIKRTRRSPTLNEISMSITGLEDVCIPFC